MDRYNTAVLCGYKEETVSEPWNAEGSWEFDPQHTDYLKGIGKVDRTNNERRGPDWGTSSFVRQKAVWDTEDTALWMGRCLMSQKKNNNKCKTMVWESPGWLGFVSLVKHWILSLLVQWIELAWRLRGHISEKTRTTIWELQRHKSRQRFEIPTMFVKANQVGEDKRTVSLTQILMDISELWNNLPNLMQEVNPRKAQ